jgi:hypothetical protein
VKSDIHQIRDRHRQEMQEFRETVKEEARGRRTRSR